MLNSIGWNSFRSSHKNDTGGRSRVRDKEDLLKDKKLYWQACCSVLKAAMEVLKTTQGKKENILNLETHVLVVAFKQ